MEPTPHGDPHANSPIGDAVGPLDEMPAELHDAMSNDSVSLPGIPNTTRLLLGQQQLLIAEMARLNNHIGRLTDMVVHTEHGSPPPPDFADAHPRSLLSGWEDGRNQDASTLNLSSVLRYYERSMRHAIGVYYLITGALYVRNGSTVLFNTSGIYHIPSLPWRLIAGIFLLLVGIVNLTCIFAPLERLQIAVIYPTVAGATLALLLAVINAASTGQVYLVVISFGFWGLLTATPILFGTAIRGRLGLRNFTLQLADASETSKNPTDHPDAPKPPLTTGGETTPP